MKKKLLVIMILGVLLLTGCNKTTTCKLTIKETSYNIESVYKVVYKDKYALSVESTETITSSDSTILDYLESSLKSTTETYKDLKYYDTSIKKEKGKIIEKTKINYEKLDINKFLEINPQASSLFTNGKIKYDDIISLYKTLGATCK